jgi:Kef-type K+ transport system membrane component KefB
MPGNFELFVHFTLQLGVILAACRLCGIVLRWLGQPQVVADMAAGFVLGPSLLGLLLPEFQKWLFPVTGIVAGTELNHPSTAILYTVGHLGLVLYMFIVGIRLDLSILAQHVRHSVATSLTGLGVPLLAGCGLGLFLSRKPGFFQPGVGTWESALFVAAVLSVTAFPMLARIVQESGVAGTRTGVLALACAAVDDVGAWTLLAFVVVLSTGDVTTGLVTLGGTVAYVTLVILAGRPALRRLDAWATTARGMRPEALVVTLALLLFASWGTDTIGVYSVFGAFVLGTAMPRGRFTEQLIRRVEPLTVAVLLPAFFVFAGLQTHAGMLLGTGTALVFLAVLTVAVVSKGVACFIAARLAGLERLEAASLGALMNARGLTELILLNIGLQRGIITGELYTVLALMTLFTTVAAAPLHKWFHRRAADRGGPPTSPRHELVRARDSAVGGGPPAREEEHKNPVTPRSTSHRR